MLCCISILHRHRIQQATNELASKTTLLLKEMSSLCGGSSPTAVSSVKYKALQFIGIASGYAAYIPGMAMLHISLGWLCCIYPWDGYAAYIPGMAMLHISLGWLRCTYPWGGYVAYIPGVAMLHISPGWPCCTYPWGGYAAYIPGVALLHISLGWLCCIYPWAVTEFTLSGDLQWGILTLS